MNKPAVAGAVSQITARRAAFSVARSEGKSPRAACADSVGKMAVAMP